MSMVKLVYASTFEKGSGPNDVQNILNVSKEKNKDNNITGVLCFNHRYFLQCLEGGRDEVNKIYNGIVSDARHKEVVLLDYELIDERLFSNWSMSFVRIDELTQHIVLKYGTTSNFNPYEMLPGMACAFIKEIAAERLRFLEAERKLHQKNE